VQGLGCRVDGQDISSETSPTVALGNGYSQAGKDLFCMMKPGILAYFHSKMKAGL
jgi:hypothetical protein